MRKALLVLMVAIGVRAYAADPHCTADETLQQCFTKFKHRQEVAAAEAVTWTPKAQANVAAKNTGVSSLAVPTQSTTKDFLSMLAGALAVPMTGTGARPLTLETNFPVAMLGGDEQRIKLQTVLVRPELSSEIKTRLAANTAAMDTLKNSMSELDDVTVSLSVDPSAQHLGRSITPHTDAYRSMLAAWAATGAVDTALETFSASNAGADRAVAMKSLNSAAPNDLVTDAEATARKAGADSVPDFADAFARLLHNQPQIFGSVLYHSCKNLAGPKERAARLTYEKGFHNLNAFYAVHPNCSGKTADTECAKQLLAFAGDKKDENPADRMAFSIEYRGSSNLLVSLSDPDPIINFKASRARTFVYSAGYGRNAIGKEGRIDVAVNYEDTTLSKAIDFATPGHAVAPLTTPTKAVHDRFVASATYTYKINNMMAMPLSLIYANHASYLGDVGRKLNAHFGITMKLPSP